MAAMNFGIPDAQLNRVIDALCQANGWDATKGGKPAFAKSVIIQFIHSQVEDYERGLATAAAVNAIAAPPSPGVT